MMNMIDACHQSDLQFILKGHKRGWIQLQDECMTTHGIVPEGCHLVYHPFYSIIFSLKGQGGREDDDTKSVF